MKYYAFNYYDKFKCIKDKCKHSCCVGWEIDIDKRSENKYLKLNHDYREKLLNGINPNKKSFKKDNDGRCVFLNDKNLCEIINNVGERYLCQTCKDHPRFRNFFNGETEVGLGLCCEESARIILSQKEKIELIFVKEKGSSKTDTEFQTKIKDFRKKLINFGQKRNFPFSKRLEFLQKESKFRYEKSDLAFWKEFYKSLSKLNPDWDNYLNLIGDDREITGYDVEFEQLLVYFIFRHVSSSIDGIDLLIRAAFSFLSVKIIMSICLGVKKEKGQFTFNDLVDVARQYSSEIEYSEDNLNCIFNEIESRLNLL